MMHYMKHRIKSGLKVFSPPCKLAFRGHLSKIDEPKVRAVWVYPFEVCLLEFPFSLGLNRALQADPDGPLLFGPNALTRLR